MPRKKIARKFYVQLFDNMHDRDPVETAETDNGHAAARYITDHLSDDTYAAVSAREATDEAFALPGRMALAHNGARRAFVVYQDRAERPGDAATERMVTQWRRDYPSRQQLIEVSDPPGATSLALSAVGREGLAAIIEAALTDHAWRPSEAWDTGSPEADAMLQAEIATERAKHRPYADPAECAILGVDAKGAPWSDGCVASVTVQYSPSGAGAVYGWNPATREALLYAD